MDLNNTTFPSVKLEALPGKVQTLLTQLQQAGLFRALVIQSQGNRVLLDTAFGQLSGKAPDNLKKGDEILARLIPGKSEPTIKIEQHNPRLITVNSRNLSQLFNPSNPQPVVAKVVSHSSQQTQLLIDQKSINIPRQNQLQPGETLVLKPLPNRQIEVSRVQPEVILKKALSQLLPQNLQAANKADLPNLQKLVSQILQLKAENLKPQPTQTTATQSTPSTSATTTNAATSATMANAKTASKESVVPAKPDVINTPSDKKPINLETVLRTLAQPVTRAEKIDAPAIKQILNLLSLIKSPATQLTSTATPIPQQLQLLKQEIQQSPDKFLQLVRHIISVNAGNPKTAVNEALLMDTSNTFRNDLLQQVEQSLTQLLTQKTSVRLQLEQNQPLQINVNIPIQVDEKVTPLTIKLKEKQRNELNDEQHWEINLSFEFGLLGLISTHILLQGQKISAHFWAVQSSTKNLIEQQMDSFKQQLSNSGFELGLFDCFVGQPASAQDSSQPVSDNLVDVKV